MRRLLSGLVVANRRRLTERSRVRNDARAIADDADTVLPTASDEKGCHP